MNKSLDNLPKLCRFTVSRVLAVIAEDCVGKRMEQNWNEADYDKYTAELTRLYDMVRREL